MNNKNKYFSFAENIVYPTIKLGKLHNATSNN